MLAKDCLIETENCKMIPKTSQCDPRPNGSIRSKLDSKKAHQKYNIFSKSLKITKEKFSKWPGDGKQKNNL